jgi:hypothetical protein
LPPRKHFTSALYDTEQCYPANEWICRLGTVPGFERTCDLAAFVLSQRWPETYQFDPEGPREQRDEQRVACLNATRRLRGVPELVLLGGRFFDDVGEEQIASLLDRVTAGGGNAAAAQREIVKLGLPALRHVVQHADGFAEEHPARDALEALVVRLSERGRVDSLRALGEYYGRILAERIDAGLSAGPDVPVSIRLERVRATGDEE